MQTVSPNQAQGPGEQNDQQDTGEALKQAEKDIRNDPDLARSQKQLLTWMKENLEDWKEKIIQQKLCYHCHIRPAGTYFSLYSLTQL